MKIIFPNICFFFDTFVVKIGAADVFALSKTTKVPKKDKTMQKGKKKLTFGTELNLALVQHLVQS